MVKINVKWGKQIFKDVEIPIEENGLCFKSILFSLTGVPIERQKFLGLRKSKFTDDTPIADLKLREGQTVVLIGSAEKLEQPKEKTVFVEDLNIEDQDAIMEQIPPGLTNLGNTCYANACLQVLKHVPELNKELTNYSGILNQDLANNIVVTLRDLFRSLNTQHKAVQPFAFINAFRKAFPRFAQKTDTQLGAIYAQQDADEFFGTLLQTLSAQLKKGDNKEDIIKRLFEGEFEVTLKCIDAPEEKPSILYEPFHKISCHIQKETSNLSYGLEKSLVGTLEKNSPTLNKTALYTRTSRIKKLPEYLTINFVRFFWKQQQQVKAKILKDVKFPMILDVYDFCTDELKKELSVKRDAIRKQQEKEIAERHKEKKEETKEDVMDIISDSDKPGNQTGWYELCGVVTHVGRSADSGHYIGWVKEGDDRWLKFDDDKVSVVTDEDIKKLSGGGDWPIAYMLLYRSRHANGKIVGPP